MNRVLLICISCLVASLLPAQSKVDSLKQVWTNVSNSDSIRFKAINKYYREYTFAQPDTSFIIATYHYKLASERNDIREMSNSLNEQALVFYLKGQTELSMTKLIKAKELHEKLNDPNGLARLTGNIGNIYGEQNKYQEAVRYYTQTLKIFQSLKNEDGEADMLNNLAIIYYFIDNYDLSLKYMSDALEIYKKMGTEKNVPGLFVTMGSAYFEKNQVEKAIEYGEKGLEYSKATKNIYSESGSYFLLARTSKKLNQLERAAQYAMKSLAISKQLENKNRTERGLLFIAELKFDEDVQEATQLAEDILKQVDDKTLNLHKVELFNLLYKCYKEQGDNNKSLLMHEKYVIYSDSLEIEKNNLVLTREAIQNEYETKLSDKDLKNEQASAELKLNHFKKIGAILLSSAALIAIILLYLRSRTLAHRKQKEDLLEEINQLKNSRQSSATLLPGKFELNKEKLEAAIDRKLNDTDWNVLNILLEDPVISNKDIAKKAFLSVTGIGSCLRRMYGFFKVKDSKYMKISLLMEAIKISNE